MITTVVLLFLFLHRADANGDYASCLSTDNYISKDWCVNMQRNMSLWNGWLLWTQNPDEFCHPNGRMLVAPNKVEAKLAKSYQALIYNNVTNKTVWTLWVGLLQLDNQATPKDGWNWRIIHPEGYETRYPSVFAEVPWYAAQDEPNDFRRDGVEMNWQNYGALFSTVGFRDFGRDNVTMEQQGQGVVCQYTYPRSVLRQAGNVRINDPLYIVQQFTHPVPSEAGNICAMTCRQTGFCVSFSFNSITSDCQINALDPKESTHVPKFTTDSSYVSYTRGI
uniref:Apple domain-containing protein n=1 Tax=Plectus sambesii TaxID=2011161 RepID=A0A914WAM0_9BILA